jgi:uncharacterized protein YdeI (YjbR/CyaY-like superfamily)
MADQPDPVYFEDATQLRAWFASEHATAREVWVGYYKKPSGRAGLSWPASVDEALCYGWIDGIRKRVDDDRCMIRFTPRRAGSNWSTVNIGRATALAAEGRMHPEGLRAFQARDAAHQRRYSYEQRRDITLASDLEAAFRAQPAAFAFFAQQPAGYRHLATYWVMQAKRDQTRRRRLQGLIDASAAGTIAGLLDNPDPPGDVPLTPC